MRSLILAMVFGAAVHAQVPRGSPEPAKPDGLTQFKNQLDNFAAQAEAAKNGTPFNDAAAVVEVFRGAEIGSGGAAGETAQSTNPSDGRPTLRHPASQRVARGQRGSQDDSPGWPTGGCQDPDRRAARAFLR